MKNNAHRKEAKLGIEFEKRMKPILVKNGFIYIDGKGKKTSAGKKYRFSFKYIKGLEHYPGNLHWDFVYEADEYPIFVDCKSTSISHKDHKDILIKSVACKSKFPECKIKLIYYKFNNSKSENRKYARTLVENGMIDLIVKSEKELLSNPKILIDGEDKDIGIGKFFQQNKCDVFEI